MDYNDFPILNNSDYENINKQYQAKMEFDKKHTLYNISHELQQTIQSAINLAKSTNKQINHQLENLINIATKQKNNISTIFNTSQNENQSVDESLFNLLKRVLKIISLYLLWGQNEEKIYYKSLSTKSINELIAISSNILSSLNLSQFYFFKFM